MYNTPMYYVYTKKVPLHLQICTYQYRKKKINAVLLFVVSLVDADY